VVAVALKTPLQIRLGICIHKTSLLNRPDDYIGFTPSCLPKFYNKIAPMPMYVVLSHHLDRVRLSTNMPYLPVLKLQRLFNDHFQSKYTKIRSILVLLG